MKPSAAESLVLRPVREQDHAAVLSLAQQAGIGMTSLPPDEEVLQRKLTNAVASFAGKPKRPREENFLFVLEDLANKTLAGTVALVAHVGLSRPFYSYKISTIVQASSELKVYSEQRVLHMVNDYTGASEVGSLFLAPEYRRDGIGKFLARARYLMLAEFPDLFSDVVIAEVRGVQNRNGESPFYNNLARHFFQIEFQKADYVNATKGGQFIADLMPKYPIYEALLPAEARAVIGQPFEASRPAMEMLKREGFYHQGYVDVFDAGPTMQADRNDIRTVRESMRADISSVEKDMGEGPQFIISNTTLGDFRMCVGYVGRHHDHTVSIDKQAAEKLGVKKGDAVRFTAV